MNLFLLILIAISLSMDAFSLSLAYGTLGMNKKDKYLLSIVTGIFHFFMPLIGLLIGRVILKFINIDSNIIVAIILSFIGGEMIVSSFKGNQDIKVMKLPDFFLFALAVSLDSFSVGITLTKSNTNLLIGPLTFALFSYIFTFVGLTLGNKIQRLVGKISTIIGGFILVIVGVFYLI